MTVTQFVMVSEWMVNRSISEFVSAHPDASRLELVWFSPQSNLTGTETVKVIRRCRRSQLSPCERHDAWGLERGKYFFWVILNDFSDPRVAKHSRRPHRPCSLGGLWAGINFFGERHPSQYLYKGTVHMVECTRGPHGAQCDHAGGGYFFFWHGCVRGRFSCPFMPIVGGERKSSRSGYFSCFRFLQEHTYSRTGVPPQPYS